MTTFLNLLSLLEADDVNCFGAKLAEFISSRTLSWILGSIENSSLEKTLKVFSLIGLTLDCALLDLLVDFSIDGDLPFRLFLSGVRDFDFLERYLRLSLSLEFPREDL